MSLLAGSKRPAGTPVASPSKPSAKAKRSRTQYDYYDEDEAENLLEDQWSDEDMMDSSSIMSLDGEDDGEIERLLAGPGRHTSPSSDDDDDNGTWGFPTYRKDREVTGVCVQQPRGIHLRH